MIRKRLASSGYALALTVAAAIIGGCAENMKPPRSADVEGEALRRAAEKTARWVAEAVSKNVFEDELRRRKMLPRQNAQCELDARRQMSAAATPVATAVLGITRRSRQHDTWAIFEQKSLRSRAQRDRRADPRA